MRVVDTRGMFTRENAADSVAELLGKRGPLTRDEIYCGFTSGEWPGDNLLILISDGLTELLTSKRATTGLDGKVKLL